MSAAAVRQDLTTVDEPRDRPPAVQSESVALISMIERAARDPSVDIDKMGRLLEMQERVLARQSQAAFAVAFAEMQPKLPVIRERGKGDKGATYALWEDVNEAIIPILQEHGFGLSFRTGRTPERVTVTAILLHRDGHREETTLELPVDTSGSKNAVQAVGSSTSYGKRYTAMALLNLTSRLKVDRDDDGRGAGQPLVTDREADDLREYLESVGGTADDRRRLLKKFGVESFAEIPVARLAEAQDLIKQLGDYLRSAPDRGGRR